MIYIYKSLFSLIDMRSTLIFTLPKGTRYQLSTFAITAFVLFPVLIYADASNIGFHAQAGFNSSEQCSRICKSNYCDALPALRYGKYCGLFYTGCPGETPCDGLDACCMHHDLCIGKMKNDYLSQECNKGLMTCVNAFGRSGAPSFEGSTCEVDQIVKAINNAMKAAIFARKVFGKP